MWILSIDTALHNGNIALAQNGAVAGELVLGDDMRHSSRVLEAVAALMRQTALALTELDGLAVTVGPGSFTGLRIGISTVKGLAFALNKPVAGLCVLEALARQADFEPSVIVTAMVDGSKQEVFTRSFRRLNGVLEPVSGYANSDYQAASAALRDETLVIGNGAPLIEPFLTETQRALVHIAPPSMWLLQNRILAQMAWEKFRSGDTVAGGAVIPNYIRKSDAELALKAKASS